MNICMDAAQVYTYNISVCLSSVPRLHNLSKCNFAYCTVQPTSGRKVSVEELLSATIHVNVADTLAQYVFQFIAQRYPRTETETSLYSR